MGGVEQFKLKRKIQSSKDTPVGLPAAAAKLASSAAAAKKQIPKTKPFWWWVKSCTLPSYEIGMSEYQLVNKKFKYPGMLVWNDVTITMVDAHNSMELLHRMLTLSGYSGEKACGDTGISKEAFRKQGSFRIQLLDANGLC